MACPPESAEQRLSGIRTIARALLESRDPEVWQLAMAIDQLCLGTITVRQAYGQTEAANGTV